MRENGYLVGPESSMYAQPLFPVLCSGIWPECIGQTHSGMEPVVETCPANVYSCSSKYLGLDLDGVDLVYPFKVGKSLVVLIFSIWQPLQTV